MANFSANGDNQLTNYLNSLGYENYIWKTKYNELWTNYLGMIEETKKLQEQLTQCKSTLQNHNTMDSIQNMLQNNAAAGNRNPIIELLQKKNAELISILLEKDAIIEKFQRNIPNSPPPTHPPRPPLIPQ